jgi:hypothetical protein
MTSKRAEASNPGLMALATKETTLMAKSTGKAS